MAKYEDFTEVAEEVHQKGGIASFSMEELRDAHGAGRLGKHVIYGIQKNLAGKGLGHRPKELPFYGHYKVRLYTLGSPFADCLKDMEDFTEDADERLRNVFANDSDKILQSIRELVCD